MGVSNCSMFCCMLLYVHSSIAIILMGKRELVALLNLSSWCLVMVGRLFFAVPQGCLPFVIVVFPDHTHFYCWKSHVAAQLLCTIMHKLMPPRVGSLMSWLIVCTSKHTLMPLSN